MPFQALSDALESTGDMAVTPYSSYNFRLRSTDRGLLPRRLPRSPPTAPKPLSLPQGEGLGRGFLAQGRVPSG